MQYATQSCPIIVDEVTQKKQHLFSGPTLLPYSQACDGCLQLLLTNFSVAFGISSLGGSSDSDDESESLAGNSAKLRPQ